MLRFFGFFLLAGAFGALSITLFGALPLDAGLVVMVSYLLAGTLCMTGSRDDPPAVVFQTQASRQKGPASLVAYREQQAAQDLADAHSRMMKLALLIVVVGFVVVMLQRYLTF